MTSLTCTSVEEMGTQNIASYCTTCEQFASDFVFFLSEIVSNPFKLTTPTLLIVLALSIDIT